MSIRNALIAIWFAAMLTMAGCGGSASDSNLSDPNGTFSFDMNPVDWETGTMAVEIEASKGEITSGFARFVGPFYEAQITSLVTGFASEGSIEGTAVFEEFRVEFVATFTGSSWQGSYQVLNGSKVLEEGDLTITKGSSTRNIAGAWTGSAVAKSSVPIVLDIEQKGNLVAATGTFNGFEVLGTGSIIGRSVSLRLNFTTDVSGYNMVGTTNVATDIITGNGEPENFTFTLEKD